MSPSTNCIFSPQILHCAFIVFSLSITRSFLQVFTVDLPFLELTYKRIHDGKDLYSFFLSREENRNISKCANKAIPIKIKNNLRLNKKEKGVSFWLKMVAKLSSSCMQ